MVLASGMPADQISGPCGAGGHLDAGGMLIIKSLSNNGVIFFGGKNDHIFTPSYIILVHLKLGCHGNQFLIDYPGFLFFFFSFTLKPAKKNEKSIQLMFYRPVCRDHSRNDWRK